MIKKALNPILRFFLALCFIVQVVPVSFALETPSPIQFSPVLKTPSISPVNINGFMLDPKKPLSMKFMVDRIDQPDLAKADIMRQVKYFLAGITVPEGDLWVNLSPYERDRILPAALTQTDLGRDLLEQDYLLKQVSSALLHPDTPTGRSFWARMYKEAKEQFGTTSIPINTINKVWIVADQAEVYVKNNAVYITKSTLKVMLEEDYVANSKQAVIHQAQNLSTKEADVMRQIIIPTLTREVNEGKDFQVLRQMYRGLILAKWYKKHLNQTALAKVYQDQSKVKGIDTVPSHVKTDVYEQYLRMFKKGVFNFVREENADGVVVPRKYFSGGLKLLPNDLAMAADEPSFSEGGSFADVDLLGQQQTELSYKDKSQIRTHSKDLALTADMSEADKFVMNHPEFVAAAAMKHGGGFDFSEQFVALFSSLGRIELDLTEHFDKFDIGWLLSYEGRGLIGDISDYFDLMNPQKDSLVAILVEFKGLEENRETSGLTNENMRLMVEKLLNDLEEKVKLLDKINSSFEKFSSSNVENGDFSQDFFSKIQELREVIVIFREYINVIKMILLKSLSRLPDNNKKTSFVIDKKLFQPKDIDLNKLEGFLRNISISLPPNFQSHIDGNLVSILLGRIIENVWAYYQDQNIQLDVRKINIEFTQQDGEIEIRLSHVGSFSDKTFLQKNPDFNNLQRLFTIKPVSINEAQRNDSLRRYRKTYSQGGVGMGLIAHIVRDVLGGDIRVIEAGNQVEFSIKLPDKAMNVVTPLNGKYSQREGGIDLNQINVNDSKGSDQMVINQQMLDHPESIQGFIPVLVGINTKSDIKQLFNSNQHF